MAQMGASGRGGTGSRTNGLCNFDMTVGDTTPVGRYPDGQKPRMALLDVAGNVWEWTGSLWGTGLVTSRSSVIRTMQRMGGRIWTRRTSVLRALRGGSFGHVARRRALRLPLRARSRYWTATGLRVVSRLWNLRTLAKSLVSGVLGPLRRSERGGPAPARGRLARWERAASPQRRVECRAASYEPIR